MQSSGTLPAGPPLGIGRPTSSAWREELLTRVEELAGVTTWIAAQPDHERPPGELFAAIDNHLDAAKRTAGGTDARWPMRAWRQLTGSSFERALSNVDAAEVDLLRLAPQRTVVGAMPSICAHVNRFLPKDDPRRLAVEQLALDGGTTLGAEHRDLLTNVQHAANTQRRRNLLRLRGFRNLLLGGIVVFSLIALGLGLVGHRYPTAIPLCFAPESDGKVKLVCPHSETPLGTVTTADFDFDQAIGRTASRGDVLLVELVGLLAAALAGAAGLRKLTTGTSTPYAVPVALALLKLPTGAVTAVVGLLLMRADFVPGLSALDSSAQILGWAVVFGIAQQLVTGFVDGQAAGLLERVGGRGAGGDRPLPAEQGK